MPSKACPVCKRLQEIPQIDWPLVSQMQWLVCSRGCAWEFIETSPSKGKYLRGALRVELPPPMDAHSPTLRMFFRSQYERFVAEAFRDGGIPFEYEKWSFQLHNRIFWIPDFHLPEHRMFVEVKGSWGVGAKSKMRKFLRMYQETTLLVLPWTIRQDFYPVEMDDELC